MTRQLIKLLLLLIPTMVLAATSDTQALDCSAPKNRFEKLVCSTSDETQLAQTFQEVLNEWKPYVAKLSYYPKEQPQALSMWYRETNPLFDNWTEKCKTFICKQAKIAQAMEIWAFPKEPYEALLGWIKKEGDRSPLLASDMWKLSAAEASAVWAVSSGKIYRIGEDPEWLSIKSGSYGTAPKAAPPFIGRKLTYFEARNLNKITTEISPWSSDKEPVAGITDAMRFSISVSDGGSAKCSRNPLDSGIFVSSRFPNPPDAPIASWRYFHFKIVEIRNAALAQRVPSCVFDDPNPVGFYPGKGKYYSSRIVIDDIRGQFVRPDGTFWLSLSDNNWYRFKRDMTSDAAEIGSKFHVLTETEFSTLRDKSKNIAQLDINIMRFIENRGSR